MYLYDQNNRKHIRRVFRSTFPLRPSADQICIVVPYANEAVTTCADRPGNCNPELKVESAVGMRECQSADPPSWHSSLLNPSPPHNRPLGFSTNNPVGGAARGRRGSPLANICPPNTAGEGRGVKVKEGSQKHQPRDDPSDSFECASERAGERERVQ